MDIFDRSQRPARFAIKLYKTNPDDVDPPLDTLDVVDLDATDDASAIAHGTALAKARKRVRRRKVDSWEIIERADLRWEAFDAQCGSWEWHERTVLDSWQVS